AQTRTQLRAWGAEVVDSHRIAPRRKAFVQDCRKALEAARASLTQLRYDGVLVFAPWKDGRQIEELTAALSDLPVPVMLMADVPTQRM
ncbi:hypothetical protein J8J27_29620, partial [Mycobacterium tuberculosis]|nr:hypothetical protein [Mycobacterium tuberculosis]